MAWIQLVLLLVAGALWGLHETVQAQQGGENAERSSVDLAEIEVVEAVLESVELAAVKDAYTASNRPGDNYGGEITLSVGYQQSDGDQGAMRTFIQFDFPGRIPAGATINRARLRLFQQSAIGIDSMRIGINQPSGSWDEFGITWANQPGFSGDERASEFVNQNTEYKEWDITTLARDWKAGSVANHGIIVEGLEVIEDNRRLFFSREVGDASLRPVLLVDYTPSGADAPPRSSFVHPTNPFQNQAAFRVEWTADDPSGTGIAYFDVQVRQPGQSWQNWQVQTAAREAVFVGEHGHTYEFQVRAVNNASLAEPFPDIAGARTTVDIVPPVVNVQPLAPFTNQGVVQVNWTGLDDVSGVMNYDVQVRYGAGPWTDALIGTVQTSFNLPTLEGQAAQLRVRAGDNAGNLSSYEAAGATVGTTLDTTPPRACILRFVPSVLQTVTPFSVSWLGDDGGGAGVSSFDLEYRYNGGPWIPYLSGVSTSTATFTPVSGAGFYEFRIRARDVLGNQGQYRTMGSDGAMSVGVEMQAANYFLPGIETGTTTDPFLAQCRRQ